MENESLRKTGVSNTVMSVMIFVAAVTFAGWYVYSRGVTVSDTSAQNASILANGSLSPTP